MPSDDTKLLELEKRMIIEEKKRLGLLQDSESQHVDTTARSVDTSDTESENANYCRFERPENGNNHDSYHVVERLDLRSCHEDSVARSKQAFIEKLEKSENPLTSRSDDVCNGTMLRYGEYSPNNPYLRVAHASVLGLGEYEQRKQLIAQKRQDDYRAHLAKQGNGAVTRYNLHAEQRSSGTALTKAVQTDIQNINSRLVQYELHSQNPAERELSPIANTKDTKMHNSYEKYERKLAGSGSSSSSTKLKSILTNRRSDTSQDRLLTNHVPSIMDGFSYEDRDETLARERAKRETYQAELRQQIEDKHRQVAMQKERERFEEEMANRRWEEHHVKQHEDHLRDEQRRVRMLQSRRGSEELTSYVPPPRYRKYSDSESNVVTLRNTIGASTSSSTYSPPALRKPYSFNIPASSVFANPASRYVAPPSYGEGAWRERPVARDYHHQHVRSESLSRCEPSRTRANSFNRYETRSLSRYESLSGLEPRVPFHRYDSLSRMDALSLGEGGGRYPRRHSATHASSSSSARMERGSCSRLDDPLPMPVLKARSPVAKDLKRSVAIDSTRHGSDAVRKLEDKWQIPAVQKSYLNKGDGSNRSILTQLGAIRMQLQQEQLRMDETLRNRCISKN